MSPSKALGRRIALAVVAIFVAATFVRAADVLARAGGGGSSSGGSSGGSSHSSSSSRSSSRSSGSGVQLPPWAIGILVFGGAAGIAVLWYVSDRNMKRAKAEREAKLAAAAAKDPAWDKAALEARVREVFMGFQKAWSEFDVKTMETLLTASYHKRMVLELAVLQNLKRRNSMEAVELGTVQINGLEDAADDAGDWFEAIVAAKAKDSIVDLAADRTLFTDVSSFQEYWKFRREGGAWKLDVIRQATESAAMSEWTIANFAQKNDFYYDPDFGWLMMPDKGALFGRHPFGKADINNHVIGWYRGKVVEFYTYVEDPNADKPTNWLVAQAILPIEHRDILVRKRHAFMGVPKGLREIETEFGDFNKKFQVCADPEDSVTTFELLTTNFMEKIFDLPFDLNVEVVGNVLYLYTGKRDVSYQQMLEVLSWAFDEMKM